MLVVRFFRRGRSRAAASCKNFRLLRSLSKIKTKDREAVADRNVWSVILCSFTLFRNVVNIPCRVLKEHPRYPNINGFVCTLCMCFISMFFSFLGLLYANQSLLFSPERCFLMKSSGLNTPLSLSHPPWFEIQALYALFSYDSLTFFQMSLASSELSLGPSQRLPEFWDNLSKLWLTTKALRELDRINANSISCPLDAHPPKLLSTRKKRKRSFLYAPDFLNSCGPEDLEKLKKFSRAGGPDISYLREVNNNPVCVWLKLKLTAFRSPSVGACRKCLLGERDSVLPLWSLPCKTRAPPEPIVVTLNST